MVRGILTALTTALVAASTANASAVTVETSPAIVHAQEQFLLVVKAVGKQVGEPELPEIDGLHVNRTPTQRSDQYTMGTGVGMNVNKTRAYAAVAETPGKIVIPPIRVVVDGQPEDSPELVIDVRPARTSGPPDPAPTARISPQPTRAEGFPDPDRWVFVTSEVDREEVYVGENVRLAYTLWRIIHRNIETGTYPGANIVHPTVEGFYAAEPQVQRYRRRRNGTEYEVHEYSRLLYPTRPGILTIGPWQWQGLGRVWSVFSGDQQRYNLSTPSIAVQVKPLPPSPPGFSGAVGSYALSAELSRSETLQGVPVELTVRISGRGNPDVMGTPVVPDLPNAFVADPTIEVSQTMDASGAFAERLIRYAVTPLEPGTLEIPPLTYTYFDPETAQYEQLFAGPFTVIATASREAARPLVTAEDSATGRVDILYEDILPIITTPAGLDPRPGPGGWLAGVLMIFPAAGYIAAAGAMARRRRLTHDTAYARSLRAQAKAKQRLKLAAGAQEPASDISRALTGYLADKRNAAEAGMTAAESERLLVSVEAPDAARDRVVKILQRCERAQYGDARLSEQEARALVDGALAAVRELEVVFKKGRRP